MGLETRCERMLGARCSEGGATLLAVESRSGFRTCDTHMGLVNRTCDTHMGLVSRTSIIVSAREDCVSIHHNTFGACWSNP